ncbi:NF-kappa-B inhibitor-interacting Ras-like protein 2 isoform 3-T4 [Thomomys bottae]
MGKSCKVVVCGQASVGKTSILEQLLYGNHVVGSEMIETQEDIYVGSIETDRGVREQVRFYDTRGLRDGAELPRHCFSCTDGYVLVYSTDSRESFQRVELLKKEIDKSKDKKEVTIVVLGNKCDLQEQRRVDPDVAQHWAKSEKLENQRSRGPQFRLSAQETDAPPNNRGPNELQVYHGQRKQRCYVLPLPRRPREIRPKSPTPNPEDSHS